MAILDAARARGIPVHVVIYPYHAHLLEILRITGLWSLFEEWKRELTHRVATHGRVDAILWDFSGYHPYAREPVPGAGDKKTRLKWYWEAGHFKKELGHQMLERMFGAGDPRFGVVLTPGMVESHLQSIRRASEDYRREQPQAVAALEHLSR